MPDEKKTTFRAVVCRPMERAEVMDIGDDLESMQEVVGGLIEEYMPFYDENDPRVEDVAIICDDEGKMKHAAMNRAILDDKGSIQDIIAGPFFICYAPIDSEKFESLPKDLEDRFAEKFRYPELFLQGEKGLYAEKYDPGPSKPEQEAVR